MPDTFTFEEAQAEAPSGFSFEEAIGSTPEREQKRAALAEEGRRARVEARQQEMESTAADVVTGALKAASQLRPDLLLKYVVELPYELDRALGLVPKESANPVEQPLLSPEHVENIQNALRNLSQGESPMASTTEAQRSPVEQGVEDFENQMASGMTSPDAVVALAAGAKIPGAGVPVARTFQAGMVGELPNAVQSYLEARKSGDTTKTVTAALNVAASAGLPAAMEWGLGRGNGKEVRGQRAEVGSQGEVQTFGRDLETPSGAAAPEQFSFEEASQPAPEEGLTAGSNQPKTFKMSEAGEPGPVQAREKILNQYNAGIDRGLKAAKETGITVEETHDAGEDYVDVRLGETRHAATAIKEKGGEWVARDDNDDLITRTADKVEAIRRMSEWVREQAEGEAYEKGNQSEDLMGLTPAEVASYDLSKHIDLPDGFRLRDTAISKSSFYWMVESPEGVHYKLRISDHEPSVFRENEFGENDAVFFAKPLTAENFHDAMERMEHWLEEQAAESGASGKTSSLNEPLKAANQTSISHSGLGDKAEPGAESRMVSGGGESTQSRKGVKHAMGTSAPQQARTMPKTTPAAPAPPVPARPRTVVLPARGNAPGAPAVMPPVTPARVGNFFTRARQAFQSVFSPQNIDPTAKRFANIIRHYNGQAAVDLVRADAHLGEMRSYFDKTPVAKDWVYDPNQPLPHNYAVIDAMERARTRLPAELQSWARTMDDEFAWRIAEVKKLKPGAMQSLIQNYFPHMWEPSPGGAKGGAVQSFMAEAAARSPLHGSKAFLNQRSLPLTVDGLARGLRPISDNPVDLALAKLHQMDKFIMASRTIQEAKQNGMLKYFPLGRKIPAGRTVVDDPAFTVYAPPFLEVPEAFDAGIRTGLVDFMQKMGFRYQRVAKLGVNQWGQYENGVGKITAKFGAPDFVIMHEIGHGLQERYDFLRYLTSNSTLQGEMSALADLRGKGTSASRKFKKYIQTPDEQVANAVHAYLYAPEEMGRVAPHVQTVIYNLTRQFPELGELNDIKPGLAVGSSKMNLPLAGPVLAGRWTLPDGAAAVLTNFLSPGLGKFMAFRTLRTASNILNGAQLGLSAFHVGFTSLDAVVSSVATSLAYGLRGDWLRAGKSAAFAPFAPVANYYVGKAVQRAMVEPPAAGGRLRVPVLDFPRLGIKGFSADLSPAGTDVVRNIAELAVKGGLRATVDPFWKTEVTRNLVRAFHEGGVQGYAKAGLRVPFAIVEQAMRPIAEFLVPRQKLGVFAQLALQEMHRMGWGAAVDDVRAGMARAADATEDRMGQMTYDNLFYNKAVKDVALLGFRAYGWQLGKYRHLYGAASDAVKLVTGQGGVTNRMLYPVALTMVAATAGAIVHRLLTGTNPQTLQDYLLPQNGQVGQDGRPQRLMIPTYLKDLQSDWKDFPNYQKMGASFYHKLNPWVAEVADMWRNQDYYGVEIRHPDDPWAKQMGELSAYAAKQFTPFSIVGTMKLAEEKSPTAQLVLPFFGIVPAKKALTMTPAETLASDIIRSSLPAGSRTQEQADHSQLLKTIARDMRNVPGAKLDPSVVGQLKAGDEARLVSMLTLKPLQYQIQKMSAEDAVRVWRLANAQERELLQQQVALKLANSKTLDPVKRSALLKEVFR